MKTTKITKADIESSVLSVPPLARRADYSIDCDGNARILAHLRAGGVKTFMYGGNANLYNMAPSEFVTLCELLIELSKDSDWMIPSVGRVIGCCATCQIENSTLSMKSRKTAPSVTPRSRSSERTINA